jgi:protein-S-isoprenylcysteine O-methyltransferase Ste14
MSSHYGYGLWALAAVNSALFILFAWTFYKPVTGREWRSFGMYSAFIVALFAEMYGFPLTIYLLSGWLARQFPQVDWLSHDAGHLLEMFFGWRVNPHFGPFHIASFAFILGGFVLLARSWPVLYRAQQTGTVALSGPYARVRHPQYVAFVLVLFGFLLQWPTLLTLAMFPVLVFAYARLARAEERDSIARFGDRYRQYMACTPGFLPYRPQVSNADTPNLPYHFARSVDLGAPAEVVFEHLDDFEELGAHMMRSSWMMAGSRMRYEFDEAHGRKAGAEVRLLGSILGMKLEIREQVIERAPTRSKSWETVGQPRMLVLAAYRMGFSLAPTAEGCRLQVFIDYAMPRDAIGRWLGRLLGTPYARWCVRNMIAEAAGRLGHAPDGTNSAGRSVMAKRPAVSPPL